jgi:superfamily II DNA or RNA helicase
VKSDLFQTLVPRVDQNANLREPQKLAFAAVKGHDFAPADGREVGIVLPVGCGKSGLLAITPFALGSKRTLIIAPNLNIADQLLKDLTPSDPKFFYLKRGVLSDAPYPEVAEIRGTTTNISDLEDADVVVTNIQQLQREDNKWLAQLSGDFFDLIQFDEAHHNVADSWATLRTKFPEARIINVSATPTRADGRLMSGEIIYSYPISEAVKNGYVKRISGYRLNPKTLRYVRREGDAEIEVSLDEVRKLGETEASFRRSIVSSNETLTTIATASIRKLRELRGQTGENRLKIIASALNMEHCKQIVAKYQELGLRADFVHSKLDSAANKRVHQKLDDHQVDVIVQVRKLGEGFDHPFLTVAAVFSLFANLGPFMQFVGRIMRIVPGTDPFSGINDGVVVFHVGGNITGVWNDFQEFADTDQEFLANLVDADPDDEADTDQREGSARGSEPDPVVTSQGEVRVENLALLTADPRVMAALEVLKEAGVQTGAQFDELKQIQPTKQATRQAKRKLLDELVRTNVGKLLEKHGLSNVGRDLDKARLGKENFVVIKSIIDKGIRASEFASGKSRNDLSLAQLDEILTNLDEIVASAEEVLFDGR